MHPKRSAFTLVELLVVIAIIGVLMTLLIPVLKAVRQQASGAVCRANQRALLVAWIMYADDNDDYLVSGQVWGGSQQKPYDWVHHTVTSGHCPDCIANWKPGMSDHQRELKGIRTGALFTYTESVDVVNCPSDDTWAEAGPRNTFTSPFRSYTVSDAMNGQWLSSYQYKKSSLIKYPAEKYVFLEEEEAQGVNWGSWILYWDTTAFRWWDPISIWHSGGTIMGFADGHVERHIWMDRSTLEMAEGQILGQTPYSWEREDLKYIRKGFHEEYK